MNCWNNPFGGYDDPTPEKLKICKDGSTGTR